VFAKAYEIARVFTRPVVLSRRCDNGTCAAGIGAFVVVNNEGWTVTANHIVEEFERAAQAAQEYQAAKDLKEALHADTTLGKNERGRRLKALPRFQPDAPTSTSAWWSWDPVRAISVHKIQVADLAFVKLEPFDPAWIVTYPVFKDPTQPMSPGRSLCRLGYPFHNIEPVFHPDRNEFELPPGSVPPPFFPNDGLFTRTLTPPAGPPTPYAVRFIETSSPGLRGQSGGPIFDQGGAVWGIQSRTMSYPLDFTPPVPGGKRGEKEHQFLNVGVGVHAETIVGAMRELGIKFALSQD
jgi:hypothetical protein